jgi:signal peptidase I
MSRPRRQLLAAALFLLLVIAFLTTFRVAVVHGDSMLPTYHDGEMVIVSRLSGTIKHGDVVLVQVPSHEILIKRVFRLPGESIDAKDAPLFNRVSEFFDPTHLPNAPLRVPPGYIVVLGDNKANSDDSRTFGTIPMKDVLGRVINAPPLQ